MPAPALHELDTHYLGIAGAASAFVVVGPSGPVLVECGCAVGFEDLCRQLAALGIAPGDLRGLLVTHVHLDHAGGAGHFARDGVPVFVHPRGARHLVEPSRLIAGSRAVHGPRYDRFYGDPIAVDAGRARAVEGGGRVDAGGLHWTALETPGHARHHHAWLVSEADGTPQAVFVGDVLGMISPGSEYLSVPVPPSDVDVPAWRGSIARLRALPRTLPAYLTHGGPRPLGPLIDAFVARMREELPLLGELAALSRTDPLAADARYREFLLPRAARAGLSDELAHALLGRAFRAMNLAGAAQAIDAGRFGDSVE